MKIATLNLQGFVNWQERQHAIERYFAAENPDVILFQEVVYLPDISPYNQVQLINQTLKYPYEHSLITRLQPSHDYQVFREGLALLSKYPILASDAIVLRRAEGDEHNRLVQIVDIQVGNHVVKLANVHFSITDVVDYATAHVQETLDIFARRNEARIIGGDFNLSHLTESRSLWEGTYSSTGDEQYVSFPSENKKIDYFLLPNGYTYSNLHTSDDYLSDHNALTIDIQFPS